MAERFFVDGPLAPGSFVLTGPEAHHLAGVLRARTGAQVRLFNGDGCDYPAEVTAVGKKEVALEVAAGADAGRELPFRLEVAAPLPKGDRGEWLVEKLTELGATAFVPLRTRRSVVHPGDGKRDKLRRVVVEASKQCGRATLLDVRPPQDWSALVAETTGLLAHPGGGPVPVLTGGRRVLAVGPEGGFTDDEVSAAVAAGWRVVGLGATILRIETAAIALAALVSWQEPLR